MIDNAMIEEITNNVCADMLGLSVRPAGRHDLRSVDSWYTAEICMTGDWNARLLVLCPAGLATHLGATMFMMEPDELTDIEVNDAVGELVNIIGGNVKGVIPGESALSLPTVETGTRFEPDNRTEGIVESLFDCEGHPLIVHLGTLECQAVV